MAALSALPIIAQAGQGLINTIGQDVASIFGAPQSGAGGQNVQGSAGSSQTDAASAPATVNSAAQTLSSSVMSMLNSVQSDFGAASSFASGKTGISKSQLEQAAQAVGGAAGPAAADQAFNAIDTSGSGQITVSQLGA